MATNEMSIVPQRTHLENGKNDLDSINLSPEVLEKVLINGDLSGLSTTERLMYLNKICTTVGINPLTRPFEYIKLNGKLTLYAKKDATDQLRKIHQVSIVKIESQQVGDSYVVTAYAALPNGRLDSDIGAVSISNLKGDALANALMKAQTKAKRRVTLSVCGLGILDETEIETIPNAQRVPLDPESNKMIDITSARLEKSASDLAREEEEIERLSSNIMFSSDMDELKSFYTEAYKYAKARQDENLMQKFNDIKNGRKGFLTRKEELSERQDELPPDDLDNL